MSFVRHPLLSFVLLALAAGSGKVQGASEYTDGFATDKAKYDCDFSSTFWPSDINNPPPRPYLSYRGTGDARGLVFRDYKGELAQLGYRFLAGAAPTGTLVRCTLRLDVSFPCDSDISQFPPGQLLYSTSPDGLAYSAPQFLDAGHRDIPIQSTKGTWYVLFTGTRVVVDNLRVSPSTPGVTIQVSQNEDTGPAGNGATPSIHHVDITGRRSSSYATIQDAIDEAESGDTVVVWPGVYEEEIRFKGKAITVQSAADAAVLTARNGYACSFYGAESNRSVLSNFVITGCGEGGIYCDGASPTLKNLTVIKNQFGIVGYGGANPNIVNCIIWQNTSGPLFQCKARYSCIEQSNPSKAAGNFNANPRFADSQNGDYHLRSQWGRYLPEADVWVRDSMTSPCLDAGDPADGTRAERTPHGLQINMGAYGGTPFASLSSGPECP